MTAQQKRAIVGYAVYLVFGALAYGIAVYVDQVTGPVVLIFIIGYMAGRISKTIEHP